MKELEFIEIIKNTLSKSSHIGDDCAYLDDLGIVITHDSLVEDIHFSREFSSPYQIGFKAIMVNLSDVYASGALPKYLTISLSLPKDIDNEFVKEFYRAVDDISKEFGVEVVGGDITGSDKIFISVCAIGTTKNRQIASRKNAKVGDYVITTGVHGSSRAGLWLLQNYCHAEFISVSLNQAQVGKMLKQVQHDSEKFADLISSHICPIAQRGCSEEIATKLTSDYAMMDTSDGLMDAFFKIASSSDVLISVDFDKVSYDKEIEEVAKLANANFKDWIFYGGEDFQLVACVNKEEFVKLDEKKFTIIGKVKKREENHFVEVEFGKNIEKIVDLEKTFNHFKEK